MTTHRQTLRFLQQRFAETGIHPDPRRGQNFLVDLNLLEVLVREANLQADDVILEVGTGTGGLTAMMAPQVAAVVTVEVDWQLQQLAREELQDATNVTFLCQDALRNKNNIHENVIEAVREALTAVPGRRFKLVANLPYSIATPLISNLLLTPIVPVSFTVTIQRELAERIVARPGTKDYGALSVWVQCQCLAEIVRILPPSVFWPRPKVESAIVHLVPDEDRRAQIHDLPFFNQFVRSMFFHRRKFLRSVMLSAFKKELTKPQVDEIMAQQQLPPETRAEQLTVASMLSLYAQVSAVLGQS